MDSYFFWCGVALNAVGAFAVLGLLAWQALEWWASFNTVRGPMMRFYWNELQSGKKKDPTL